MEPLKQGMMQLCVQQLKDKISEGDTASILFNKDGWPYAYTVGNAINTKNRFELFTVGLIPPFIFAAHADILEYLRNNEVVISTSNQAHILKDALPIPVALVKAPESITEEAFPLSSAIHSADACVPHYQLVLSDNKGRFPWDKECDNECRVMQSLFIDLDQVVVN
ncbi:DUF4262 domain-containing protein [Vibrio sp. SCSIO 43140]|uniref:DUF4262 domain-containing protein n=1 Tax=Vibrio sp. SCSIO 43140 TaxID=2819100 RepID=UPI002074B0A7|nr:DUF4262 domain-containing protein [Vibrio sp. SCSIO 43140]USD59030.1 DUF4262 domain-containing protein [Vibrio sp. SCSIO 43140]